MPVVTYYKQPEIREGEATRRLEFWKRGRGGEKSIFVTVPARWDDERIKDELEDWGSLHFPTSELVRYGWNDESDYGSRE